jgi:hypothetical protein
MAAEKCARFLFLRVGARESDEYGRVGYRCLSLDPPMNVDGWRRADIESTL